MDKKWYFDEQKALQENYFETQQQQQYNTIRLVHDFSEHP